MPFHPCKPLIQWRYVNSMDLCWASLCTWSCFPFCVSFKATRTCKQVEHLACMLNSLSYLALFCKVIQVFVCHCFSPHSLHLPLILGDAAPLASLLHSLPAWSQLLNVRTQLFSVNSSRIHWFSVSNQFTSHYSLSRCVHMASNVTIVIRTGKRWELLNILLVASSSQTGLQM